MVEFTTHTLETAPADARPVLDTARKHLGFIPNLMANMAESHVLLESYLTLMGIFDKTDLSKTEREIVLMTNSRLNGCTYCMAAHTGASKAGRVSDEVIDALRSGSPLSDPKLEALRQFAIAVHTTRGHVSDDQVNDMLAAGYSKRNVLEVIVRTSLKVLSNYTTPIVHPPLDQAFAALAWSDTDSA